MDRKRGGRHTHFQPPKHDHSLLHKRSQRQERREEPENIDPGSFSRATKLSEHPKSPPPIYAAFNDLPPPPTVIPYPKPESVQDLRSKPPESQSGQDNPESFIGDVMNRNYVDTELERHIFAYGQYTPSKLARSGIPRPYAFVCNPETEIVYQTTKNQGLIPTLGNHRIIDTGSASPIYITPTFCYLPVFGGSLSDMRLPFGALVQPFAENVDDTVPELDFLAFMEKRSKARRDLIRCKNCQAYYNPFMHVKSRSKTRICNFCYVTFDLTDEQMDAIDRINALFRDNSPLKKGSIDLAAPSHYYTKQRDSTAIAALVTRAGTVAPFRTPSKESYIYDTFSVAPVPADASGNYNDFPDPALDPYHKADPSAPPDALNAPTAPLDRKYPVYAFIIEHTSHANKLELRNSVVESLLEAVKQVEDEVFDLCVFIYDSSLYMFPVLDGGFAVSIVPEVEENFAPGTTSELLVRVTTDNLTQVTEYLNRVLAVRTIPAAPNSCAGFALNSVLKILSTDGCFGTVSIFYMTQPDIGLGSDPQMFPKSAFTLTEIQKHFYDGILQMCYASGICVDVYLCPSETRIPGDIALQHISQQTGGNCVYLPRFTHTFDHPKIYNEILRLIKVPCGYRCELKLRSSKHIKIIELLCGFHNTRAVKNFSTLLVPRIGPNLSIAFMLSLNDMVDNKTSLYLQCACLYMSTKGLPMVRVHTINMGVISSLNEIFRNANQDAIMNIIARKLAYSYIKNGKYNRDHYLNMIVEALTSYRQICAPTTPKNQLILPENLKLIPACLNSLLKYDITGEYGFDFVIKLLGILNAPTKLTCFLYARTYCLHRSIYERNDGVPEQGFKFELNLVPSASQNVYSDGIYLMDDGYKLLMFVGPHVKIVLLVQLFGHEYQFPHVHINSTELVDTPTTRNLLQLVEQVRMQHKGSAFLPLKIIAYTAKNSKYINTLLLEDEIGEEPSYTNFLISLHKSIIHSKEKMY